MINGRTTKTIIGNKAREAILRGVNSIYIPVSKTLGPEGKNALIYRTYNRGPRITNDGYTVAEVQNPKNEFINLAASAFKEACKKTNEKVGDATTTTAVIGGKLFNDLNALITESASELTGGGTMGVMALKKKIQESAAKVKSEIKKISKKTKTLKELENIATISVEDAELGKIVAKMAWEVGVDGFIDVVEGYKGKIETEVIKGMRFPAKVANKGFLTNKDRFEMQAEDSFVLVTNQAMDNVQEFSKSFQEINTKKTSKLIVLAPKFSDSVLVSMANAIKQGFFIYPAVVPSLRTEQLEDIAVYCGAKLIDKDKSHRLRSVSPSDLGFLEKLIVKDTELHEDAVATGGAGTRTENVEIEDDDIGIKEKANGAVKLKESPIQERIKILKGQLVETKQEQFKKLLERRIASMGSAVGVIRVGDSTDASALYRKLKIEDAVYASKAALRGGFVQGGGLCLKSIADNLKDDDILKAALLAPYELIQASVDDGVEITDEIIDPAEAMYYAVEHAVEVVVQLATCEMITAENEDLLLGDGEEKIAKSIMEFVAMQKVQQGQLKEAEEDSYKNDLLQGFTPDEWEYFDGEVH